MSVSLRGLRPELRPYAEACLRWAEMQRVKVEVTSVYRSIDQQRALYHNAQACALAGVAGKAISLNPGMSCEWPANPPGQSGHNYGLAWDSVVQPQFQGWWNQVRRFYGWHVPANDQIHAEVPGWQRFVAGAA